MIRLPRVWINGCFDILHIGHLSLFLKASSLGDVFVGLDSDKRVKAMKGDSRPIIKQEQRLAMIMAIKGVSQVYVFNTDRELENCIMSVQPDYLVIGEEYRGRRIIGGHYAKEIIYVPKSFDISTSDIVKKIQSI